jgi:hypothetical protein
MTFSTTNSWQPEAATSVFQTFSHNRVFPMDKKAKKKSHVLQQRIQALRQQIAGVKKQMDDPTELKSLEQQLAAAETELAKLKD